MLGYLMVYSNKAHIYEEKRLELQYLVWATQPARCAYKPYQVQGALLAESGVIYGNKVAY